MARHRKWQVKEVNAGDEQEWFPHWMVTEGHAIVADCGPGIAGKRRAEQIAREHNRT